VEMTSKWLLSQPRWSLH